MKYILTLISQTFFLFLPFQKQARTCDILEGPCMPQITAVSGEDQNQAVSVCRRRPETADSTKSCGLSVV